MYSYDDEQLAATDAANGQSIRMTALDRVVSNITISHWIQDHKSTFEANIEKQKLSQFNNVSQLSGITIMQDAIGRVSKDVEINELV